PIALFDSNSIVNINGGNFLSIAGSSGNNTININILDDKIFELNTSNSNKNNIITNVEDFNIQGNSQVVINEIDSSITGNLIISPQASVAVSKNASLIGNGEIINHGIINVANTANIGKTSDTLNIASVNSKGMLTNSGLINLNPNANIYTTKIINNKVGNINLQGSVIAMPIDTDGNIVEDNNFISNKGNIDITADGSISALSVLDPTKKDLLKILNSGNITSIGNINMPISFGETGGTITINGGKINQITGIVDGEEQVNFNILNNSEFILDNTNILNNIKTINIQGNSNIVLSNTAENIQELFIAPTAMLGIQTGATFSANKVYNNGTVNIDGNGNLGESDNLLLNDINNKGIINSSGNVYAKNIINHKDARIILSSNYLQVKENVINDGFLSLNDSANVGCIGSYSQQKIINNGEIINKGNINNLPIEFGGKGGVVTMNSSVFASIIGGANYNFEEIVNLDLAINPNTVGNFSISNDLQFNNIKTLNILPQNIVNISSLNLIKKTINVANNSSIIVDEYGDLSGGALINNFGTVSVVNNGKIGNISSMGDIVNSNVFNATSGSVKVGKFYNDNQNSSLEITNNNFASLNVYNNLGTILVGADGDLSSVDPNNLSDLFNAASQEIIIDSGGSLGGTVELGNLNNQGIIAVKGQIVGITNLNNEINGNINFNFTTPVSSGNNDVIVHGNIINYGFLNLNNGSISADKIINAGKLLTKGIINAPIELANNNGYLTILDGNINGTITGNDAEELLTINMPHANQLRISNAINKVNTINLDGNSQVVFQANISGINKQLNIASQAEVDVYNGADVSGDGAINNLGTMNIGTTIVSITNKTGSIGKSSYMGKIYNYGTINFINNDNSHIGELVNESSGTFNLKQGNLTVGLNGSSVITNKGTLTIGDPNDETASPNLDSRILNTTLVNSKSFSLVGAASMMQNQGKLGKVINTGEFIIDNTNGLNIYGDFINNDINENNSLNINTSLNVKKGQVKVGNIKNILGTILVGKESRVNNLPDLSSISESIPSLVENHEQQTIELGNYGTMGFVYPLGDVNNKGIINLHGRNVSNNGASARLGKFTNNSINASLSISSGKVLLGDLYNNLGSINISGGDLSSMGGVSIPAIPSKLFNGENQTINVLTNGTVGNTYPLGEIYNKGIINANGGDVRVGVFNNNSLGAKLNVNKNKFLSGNIHNILGVINIKGESITTAGVTTTTYADLSSISSVTKSILTNEYQQIINVNSYGKIGNYNTPLGNVYNKGIINTEGELKIGKFYNQDLSAILNITAGTVYTGDIDNQQGKILIGDFNAAGDLSSISNANKSKLTNGVNQLITVSGNGTIGANHMYRLGEVVNNGAINMDGTSIAVESFKNNCISANLNITKGTFTSYDNISNNLGSINIIAPGALSINAAASNQDIINYGIINILNNTNNNQNLITANKLINQSTGIINLGGNIELGTDTDTDTGTGTDLGLINYGSLIMEQPATITGDYNLKSNGVHIFTFSNNIPNTLTVSNTCKLEDNCKIIIATSDDLVYDLTNQFNVITATAGSLEVDPANINIITNNSIMDFSIVNPPLSDQILKVQGVYRTTAISRGLSSDLYSIIGSSLENLGIIFANNQARIESIARNNLNSELSGYNAGGIQSRGNIWIKGLIGHDNQRAVNNIEGYQSNSQGFTLGTDREILNNLWTGLSGSIVRSKINNKLFAKHSKVDGYQATLYSSYLSTKQDYYVDLLFNLGFNRTSNLRYINGLNNKNANSKFNSILPAIKFASGYIYKFNNWQLIPNISLRYAKLYQIGYQEEGIGGFGLKVEKRNFQQLEGGVGVRVSYLSPDVAINSFDDPIFEDLIYNPIFEDLIYNPSIYAGVTRDLHVKSQNG
ncbi:MAG: autotransporter domain-containing protein, partial [Gammaproteobacteria bacterium]